MMTENLSLDSLLNKIASPVLICENHTILFANQAAEKLTGYTNQQLLSRSIDSLIYVTSSKAFSNWYTQRLAAPGNESLDVRLLPANESLIWVRFTTAATLFEGKAAQILTLQDITQIRKTETELYLSKAYRDMLMTNNSDVVLVTDNDGNINYISPSVETALGYASDLTLSHPWHKWVHPDDIKLVLRAVEELRATQKCITVELRLRNIKNEYIWFETMIGLVMQVHDDQITIISAARNIHKHKLTELALREREQRLRLITDNMLDIVLEIATDGLIHYISPSCFQIMGYQPEDLMGHSHLEQVHPDDVPAVLEYFSHALVAPSRASIELRFKHNAGHYLWIEINHKLVLDDAGNLRSIVISAREISERKKTQAALQQSQHLLQQIVETAPTGIYLFDVVSNLSIFYNQKAVLGYSDADIRRDSSDFFQNRVHPDDRALFDDLSIRINDSKVGEVIVSECRMKHADGSWRWVQYHDTVFTRDEAGKPVQYLRTAHDITERKQAEQALSQSQNMLQKITDTAPFGIYIYDVKQRRDVYHNQRLIADLNPPEIPFTPEDDFYADYVHPDDLKIHKDHRQQLMNAGDGEIIESEMRGRNRDGSYDWLYFRDIVFARDEDGKPSQFLGSMQDITERKQAEQALRDSQKLLKQIMETIPLDIYIYDVDLKRNVFFNRTENMGYTLEFLNSQPSGDFFATLVHPDDLALHRDNVQHLLTARDGELLHNEYRMKHASGEWRWYDFRDIVFARHADGAPQQFLGSIQDITERKTIEAALRESQHMFQRVAETVTMQIFIYDYDLQRNIFENRVSDLGFDDQVLKNASAAFFTDLIHPDDRQEHDDIMNKLLAAADGQMLENEFRMRAADGTYAWRNYRYTPFARRPDGSLSQFLCTVLNVDERKKASDALSDNEEKLRLITDNIHDLVALTDTTMHYRYLTPSHDRILGYQPGELLGKSIYDLVHPDDVEMVKAKVMAAIEKQQPDSAEFRFRHNDGYYLWLETNGSLALGDDGEFSGAIFASRDVSERRWMQRAMLEQEKLLVMLQKEQELSSLKTRMMSRLSHELRTPLAVISTSADLLDLYSNRMTEEQRSARLQQIKTQVKHFTSMLDNISLVVKGISYSMDFAPAPYDLEATAISTINDLKELLHATHEVKLHLSGDVAVVNSDEQLMRLVLTHVLANALKYSPPTKPITVTADLSPESITLTVQDQGVGILPEDKERIFEAFFRGMNIGEVPGLGIGLSIVKDAIDSMEGSIEVDSQAGVGTTVTVRIPLGGSIGLN